MTQMRSRPARFAAAFAAVLALLTEAKASASAVLEAAVPVAAGATVIESWGGKDADPINAFTLDYPRDGEVLPPSFDIVCSVRVDDEAQYNAQYRNATLCVELNGAVAACAPLMQSHLRVEGVSVGTHTARAFIALDSTVHKQTQAVSFFVGGPDDVASHADQVADRLRREHSIPDDQDLLLWARSMLIDNAQPSTQWIDASSSPPTLLIGVKTALRTNLHLRQAIRNTWASKRSLPSDVRVIFIGCRPSFDAVEDLNERAKLNQAIALEKQVFGDLLTDELDCDDSYVDLPRKVAEFMRWGVDHFEASLSYVMIADDDIYLRVEMLKRELPLLSDRRVYAGQVWGRMFNRPLYPLRDRTTRYYLPEEIYPMKTLPPFAFGPHFLLSVDCVKFIAKNSRRLRGLAGLDDISVALWMLAIQVHPHHMKKLRNVRATACKDDLVSFADLSSLAIRVIHSNLEGGQAFCTDFDSTVWRKAEAQSSPSDAVEQLALASSLRDIRLSRVIEVITTVNGINFSYVPSIETLSRYSDRMYEHLKQVYPVFNLTREQVRHQLTSHHREFFARVSATGELDASRTELWKHNLFVADPDSPPVHVGYTSGGSFSHVLFECLFTSVYRSNPVIVAHSQKLADLYAMRPDVPVFSIFDIDCPGQERCPVPVLTHIGSDLNPSDKVIMFSGEPWGTARLDDEVVLLSTVSDAPQASHHVYISMASASFAERLDHSPLDLLSPWTARKGVDATSTASPRRFCAFLYSQCDWPHRQYFYDVLNSMEAVDAIGKCAGVFKSQEKTHKLASRRSAWYLDDAVNQYEQFKFVVAFENTIAPGYVTEKIVNAFLAGAVPIYWGNSTSLASLFNPRSYIDCRAFATLRQCADRVLEVHRSDEVYKSMRREPPIVDLDAYNEAFSWHPAVSSNATALAVAQHLFS